MIKYTKKVYREGLWFYAKLHEGYDRYGDCILYEIRDESWMDKWGVIELEVGWQDADRTYTAQDIYWVDKVDFRTMQREAA